MTGRGWAYVGAILGGAVSVAANVAHSYVPPAGAAPGWAPETGAVGGAVFWPVALFIAIEILARVPWPPGWRWVALRFAGLLPVAAVGAVVSYRHLSGLLAFYGEDPLTVVIGPLAVDGLMVMATGALIATGRQSDRRQSTGKERTTLITNPSTVDDKGDNVQLAPETAEAGAAPDAVPDLAPPSAKRQDDASDAPETITDLAGRARIAYLASVQAGAPLTGAQLGERYLRSASWGRAVIADAKASPPTNGRTPDLVAVEATP